jgi:hypothetical protein
VRLAVAVVFLVCAGLSALAHADTREVEGFEIERVVLRGSDELKISVGDRSRLLVRGDAEDLDQKPFLVRGKTMSLGYTSEGRKVRGVKYLLEVERLEFIGLRGSGTIWVDPAEFDDLRVDLDGSGDVRLRAVTAEELELSVSGSGNVQLASADARVLDVELAGSGDIDLGRIVAERMNVDMSGSGDILTTAESEDGEVGELDIGLAGSGDIDLSRLPARRVDVGLVGSGDIIVWAIEELDAAVIGSGSVSYRGTPETVDKTIMGSGSIERLD